jgi:hypothetical protein
MYVVFSNNLHEWSGISRSNTGRFKNDGPVMLELDMPADNPLVSHGISAALMVPDSVLAMYSFAEDESDLQLGIGATPAPDAGENFRGMV